MKNKVDRLQAIKEIIISYKISSQEDLLKQLTERGFNLTQATLSRDLKQLPCTTALSQQNTNT